MKLSAGFRTGRFGKGVSNAYFDRRSFIQTAAAGTFAAATNSFDNASAATPGSSAEAPGFYRFALGDIHITSLCDGLFFLPTDSIATNVEAGEKKAYFDAHYIAPDVFRLQANPLLIETGEKRILVDTGVGPGKSWAPYAGRLAKCLERGRYTPTRSIPLSSPTVMAII